MNEALLKTNRSTLGDVSSDMAKALRAESTSYYKIGEGALRSPLDKRRGERKIKNKGASFHSFL